MTNQGMKKRGKILLIITAAAVIILAAAAAVCYTMRNRGVEAVPSADFAADSVVYYYQKDPLWKDDALGNSSYHMEDSGCLVSCIAAEIKMQGVEIPGLSDITPASLNKFFTENQVYDSEGNVLWEQLEKSINAGVVLKDASDLEDGELDALLENNICPIVRVRMHGDGNYHFVLIVSSCDDMYLCMDPLNEEKRTVPLSEFGNRIYSVRYIDK